MASSQQGFQIHNTRSLIYFAAICMITISRPSHHISPAVCNICNCIKSQTMTTYLRTWVVLLIISMTGCQKNGSERDSPALTSPSGNISLILETSSDGAISYSVSHHDQTIILPSRLLQFELLGADALGSGLEITDQLASSVSDEWELPWGEQRKVIDLHNALTLSLREKKGRKTRPDRIQSI